ncbi:MAG: hypothetical protein PVG66_06875 [Chromatiales bacterium]
MNLTPCFPSVLMRHAGRQAVKTKSCLSDCKSRVLFVRLTDKWRMQLNSVKPKQGEDGFGSFAMTKEQGEHLPKLIAPRG